MKKTVGLVALLVLMLPSLGLSGALSFRFGYFIPRAQSDLWSIEFENMDFQKSDFQNTTLGIFYEHFLTREISLVIGVEGYGQTRLGSYVEFVSSSEMDWPYPAEFYEGYAISHNFSVSVTPIQLSVKFAPLGRRSGFIPYLGGGICLYVWNVKVLGDIVDFAYWEDIVEPDLGVVRIYAVDYAELRADNRFNIGFQAFAGFMIPIARRLALEAEFKFNYGKGSLGEAFRGFESFDLSGYQISLGANYWF